MGEWLIGLMALAVLATALTWALNREMTRIERDEAMRRWLATSPAAANLRRNFEEFGRQIGEALRPSLVALGVYLRAEFIPAMERMPKPAATPAAEGEPERRAGEGGA